MLFALQAMCQIEQIKIGYRKEYSLPLRKFSTCSQSCALSAVQLYSHEVNCREQTTPF